MKRQKPKEAQPKFDPKKCKDGLPHESIMGSEFCLKCGESLTKEGTVT